MSTFLNKIFCFLLSSWAMLPFSWSQNDSLIVLPFDQYMKIVSKEHPLARRANLQTEKGAAIVQLSRGGFDPYLFNDTKQNYLNDN
jgi:hypothetical protein